jgi:hypothetical protein
MMLGNLSVEQMEERLGIKFPTELVEYLSTRHQDRAEHLAADTWHCFDIPFTLMCYDRAMAEKIFNFLRPFSTEMKTQIQIGYER